MYIRCLSAFPVISSGTKIRRDFSQIEFSELTKSGNYRKHLTFAVKTNFLSKTNFNQIGLGAHFRRYRLGCHGP